MRQLFMLIGGIWLIGSSSGKLLAHGIPIDLLANSVTNRLFVIEGFELGELVLNPGIEISTSSPGLGVSFTANGIVAGTAFQFEVTQELLYWDGTGAAMPATDLLVFNPAFTDYYSVNAASGEQTGMNWATYPGGPSWDAHGLYQLVSLEASAGIYGLAVRVSAAGYDPTKPFLIPLLYDPNSQWSASEIGEGIEVLQDAIDVPFSADFDTDADVDGLDFLAWQRGFGPVSTSTLPSEGDADFDSDVDRFDFEYWESEFGLPIVSSFAKAITVPEPSASLLAFVGAMNLGCLCRSRWNDRHSTTCNRKQQEN